MANHIPYGYRIENGVAVIDEGQAEQVRDDLTAKALAALEQGGDANAIMQDLAWKLTNRLIHAPTKSLQQAARDGDDERLTILRNSLGLE